MERRVAPKLRPGRIDVKSPPLTGLGHRMDWLELLLILNI
jgi:hypothetical protein